VEPSAAKRNIRITAEARDALDMLAYVAALQQDPRLSGVILLSHQVQAQAPGMPLRFQLQAGWGPVP
jgi:Tfp pilus assembly protein PilN